MKIIQASNFAIPIYQFFFLMWGQVEKLNLLNLTWQDSSLCCADEFVLKEIVEAWWYDERQATAASQHLLPNWASFHVLAISHKHILTWLQLHSLPKLRVKLIIPSALNTDLMFWHLLQYRMSNCGLFHGFKSWV